MIALAALMLRFVHVFVLALVASLGIASGAHAFEAKPALRAFLSLSGNASGDAVCNTAKGVGKLGLSVRPAHRSIPFKRFRYYDPEAGQYVTQDPIGLAGGLGLHAYVHDPLAWVDPLGLTGCRNAQQELRALGPLSGRSAADIEHDLKKRGFKRSAAHSGGTVWTKPMPKGQTAAVRIDPASSRAPKRGFADEVPHAHKEIVPTAAVSRRGNYDPSRATTLDDAASKMTDPARTHIPTS